MDTENTKEACCSKNDIDYFFDNELFKVLSEPIRCNLIRFVTLRGPSDIGNIAEHFPQDRSVISRHLQMMANQGILHTHKESRHTIYSINGYGFLEKLETIAKKLRKMIELCCPKTE